MDTKEGEITGKIEKSSNANKLFVGGLSWDTDIEAFRQYFESFSSFAFFNQPKQKNLPRKY